MALNIGGVVCEELLEAWGESFDTQQGPTARKGFLVPWASRYVVANALLGLSSTTSVGGSITLHTPAQYPERTTMYARTIEVRGAGSPTQGTFQIQYPKAILIVSYACLPWSFGGIDYMQLDPSRPYVWAEQNMSFGVEFITIPGKQVKYANTGLPLAQDWGFMSPVLSMQITLKSVPYLPAQQILLALKAPINSSIYLGVAAGFLLFNGAENHQSHVTDATFTQDITYSFQYRPIAPWDYVYNGGWTQVLDVGTGNPVMQRSDFSGIIPLGYG